MKKKKNRINKIPRSKIVGCRISLEDYNLLSKKLLDKSISNYLKELIKKSLREVKDD